jgi:NTE family protein
VHNPEGSVAISRFNRKVEGGKLMKIGLALSGGAARGIAHIGVLKYLEERNIKPCCIAGTSAGSIVGAYYCSGRSLSEIKNLATKMSWKDLFKLTVPRKGLIKTSRLLVMLEYQLGNITFDQLKIPLIVNAVDLISGEEVLFTKGPVARAVAASCAIPGIFTPIKLDNHLLVDGGLLDNIPTAHLGKKDVDFIIAVNVVAQKPLQKEPESIFEILIQSYDIIRRYRDIPACKHADALIEPDLGDYSFWDSSKADELTERGYRAAKEALDHLDLKKKKSRFAAWFSSKKEAKKCS